MVPTKKPPARLRKRPPRYLPSPSPQPTRQSTCVERVALQSTKTSSTEEGGDVGEILSPSTSSPSSTNVPTNSAAPPTTPESPTILNSQDSYQVVNLPISTDDTTSPSKDNGILPLIERVPDVETIVEFLKGSHRVKGLLSNPTLFKTDDDLKAFTSAYFAYSKGDCIPDPNSDEWFWEDACDFMFDSLCENIPTSRKELKKCRVNYFKDGVHLVKTHFRTRLLAK